MLQDGLARVHPDNGDGPQFDFWKEHVQVNN